MPARHVILAEYFLTEDTIHLFGVRADWEEPKVVEIEVVPSDLRAFVTRIRQRQEELRRKRGSVWPVWKELLDSDEWQTRMIPFVECILSWAAPEDHLCLVPHDVLHYLPLHAVQVGGGYLIERNPVSYIPSASVLKYCQAKRKPRDEWGGAALVLGDVGGDLPSGRSEALTVAKLLGIQAHLGADATKALVIQTLQDRAQREAVDVLHFSCHGAFNRDQALKSGVGLADGMLTAEDIFCLEMHADLVTLSTCESGINELRPGDELVGLTRALIYAGTPSVIVSLWKVEDLSTEFLMAKFYERRAQGETKVEALRQAERYVRELTAAEALAYYDNLIARLEPSRDVERLALARYGRCRVYRHLFRAEGELGFRPGPNHHLFAHPFYWAPFVLIGDWR